MNLPKLLSPVWRKFLVPVAWVGLLLLATLALFGRPRMPIAELVVVVTWFLVAHSRLKDDMDGIRRVRSLAAGGVLPLVLLMALFFTYTVVGGSGFELDDRHAVFLVLLATTHADAFYALGLRGWSVANVRYLLPAVAIYVWALMVS